MNHQTRELLPSSHTKYRMSRWRKITRFFRRHWPKLTTALIGVGLFALSCLFTGRLQSFLDDLAVALFSIPIVFLFYELIDEKNHHNMMEYVYQYVDNHTFESVDDAIEAVRLLLDCIRRWPAATVAELSGRCAA